MEILGSSFRKKDERRKEEAAIQKAFVAHLIKLIKTLQFW